MNGRWIRRVWERQGPLGKLLWLLCIPLSVIYFLAVQIRNGFYSCRWIPSQSLDVPVISVGNLTTGGTGKTPACLWLAQELEQRGLRIGILSRGYKRKDARAIVMPSLDNQLTTASEAITAAGDEPSMMARLYGKTVSVASQRYRAGKELLSQKQLDALVLDDGYQHRRLRRDLDLLLLGTDHSGWVLPAGPFREPRSALRRAHVCLVTGAQKEWLSYLSRAARIPYFLGSLEAKCLIGVESGVVKEYPLSLLDRSKIVTVSGIASTEPFYCMIHEWGGEILNTLEFPDHHLYDFRDWQRIGRAARSADLIITTEKDILKLADFPVARERLFALRVSMVVENGDMLIGRIVDMIEKSRLKASSAHGA
jgi:tetraacyldisaccharide 4'-kinase